MGEVVAYEKKQPISVPNLNLNFIVMDEWNCSIYHVWRHKAPSGFRNPKGLRSCKGEAACWACFFAVFQHEKGHAFGVACRSKKGAEDEI
jgi:hypothetical protein